MFDHHPNPIYSGGASDGGGGSMIILIMLWIEESILEDMVDEMVRIHGMEHIAYERRKICDVDHEIIESYSYNKIYRMRDRHE